MANAVSTIPVPPMILAIVVGGVMAVALLWHQYNLGWNAFSKSGARLPRGSFGWPIIGESFSFGLDPLKYATSRVKRYGRVFKSSIFLQPVIMGSTPAFAKFVFSNSDIFHVGWHKNLNAMLGTKAILNSNGPVHPILKRIASNAFQQPETLRSRISTIETIVLEHLASWERSGTLLACDKTKQISWEIGNWLIFGDRHHCNTPEGKENFKNFKLLNSAIVTLPFNIPGSNYSKGLKAKKKLTAYFKTEMEKRQRQKDSQGGILGALLAARTDPETGLEVKDLDDEAISDNLVMMLFASYDTTSSTLAWMLKLLVDNPDVLRRVQAEQRECLKSKDVSIDGPRHTWEDLRNMVYTQKFFQETQRFITISPFIMRKTTEAIEYEGMLIPKGWGVAVLFNYPHFDAENYPNPERFDPNRFNEVPKLNTYMPFGGGAHRCPGNEIARLISFLFIHHVTTTYSFERVGPDRGCYYDRAAIQPKGEYPVRIWRTK